MKKTFMVLGIFVCLGISSFGHDEYGSCSIQPDFEKTVSVVEELYMK